MMDSWCTNANLSRSLTIQEFHKICRTCLMQGDIKPIFEIVYNQKSMSEILNICTTLQVQKEDYLPQNICSSCLSEIYQMYTFFQKCQESDATLRYILNLDLKTNQTTTKDDESKEVCDELEDRNTPNDVTSNHSDNDTIEIRTKRKRSIRKVRTRKSFRSDASGPPFKCKQCSEHFEQYSLLLQHCREENHTQIRTHACPVCAKTFTNSKLRQHMRAHTKEKPYKCKICSQGFSMSGNLKRHMMTHTGERPHVCNFCGRGFIQATTLHNHKKTHSELEKCVSEWGSSQFLCDYCGRGFKRLARYTAHLKKHDSKTGEIIKTHIDDVKQTCEYICTICSRACKTKHLLKAHERTHGEKSFLCNECGKSFVTKAALQSHLKVHTGEKPYCCNICQKAFAHVGSFEAHMLIHTGQKPYRCTVCARAFTQLSHLKYHARTHSGERPYICSYCGKTFALKGNLTVHTRTHTGETPYVCSVCGKGFYDSSSMKKHKRGHVDVSGGAPYMCSVCGKGFYDLISMKKHKRGHADINPASADPHLQLQVPPPLPQPVTTIQNSLDVNHMGMVIWVRDAFQIEKGA